MRKIGSSTTLLLTYAQPTPHASTRPHLVAWLLSQHVWTMCGVQVSEAKNLWGDSSYAAEQTAIVARMECRLWFKTSHQYSTVLLSAWGPKEYMHVVICCGSSN